jgi:1-phosphofructokinase
VTIARRREVTTVVDTSGAVLEAAVAARPDWIKPNHQEAGAVVGFPIIDSASALDAARALRERGARRVIVSRGRHGLVALSENGAFEARAPAVGGSGVGCGDATVAGLAVATLRRARNVQALKFAVACGSANCRAPAPGRLSADHVNRVLAEVEVAELAGGST